MLAQSDGVAIIEKESNYAVVIDNEVIDLIDVESVDLDIDAQDPTNSSSSLYRFPLTRIPLKPVQEVLKVLPDARLIYVEELLARYQAGDAVNNVIDDMMEAGYEKEPSKGSAEIDFASTNWVASQLYRYQAMLVLQRNFPFIQEQRLRAEFQLRQFHYYPTYKTLFDLTGCVASYNAVGVIEQTYSPAFLANLSTKVAVQEVPAGLTDCCFEQMEPTLQQELRWLENKNSTDLEVIGAKLAEEWDRDAIAAGIAVECGCCCADYAPENMRKCSAGHQFCRNCISKYVEQTVFGDGRSSISCISSSSDPPCQGHFSETTIRASLRGKVFDKYSEAVTRDAVKAAKLDERLKTCYFCQEQVLIDDLTLIIIDADSGSSSSSSSSSYDASSGATSLKIMRCPRCCLFTCTLCEQEGHAGRCPRPETKSETSGRLSVEEAMSEARLRKCPKCKAQFFKVEGCCAVMCPCGTQICYECRKPFTSNYNHNLCAGVRDSLSGDREAMRVAGLNALKKVRKQAKAEGVDPNNYKIDVNALLEK